ncbi:MAG: S16 family serine protease [Candidatus Pacearchaeota archaeon]
MNIKERYYLIGIISVSLAIAIGISAGFYFYDDRGLGIEDIGSGDFSDINMNKSVVLIPGINNAGQGIAAVLETTIREGSGFVLVNINDLTAGSSTQDSARAAAIAAKNYLNVTDKDSIDVIYNIKTNAGAIDGPSAGAAMAVSLVSLIEKRELNDKVSITGFVDEEGFVGPASGIEEKADALRKEGIETLLVSNQIALPRDYIREESCSPSNGINKKDYCEVDYTSGKEINISGVEVIQVSNLEEAMGYFYRDKNEQ